MAQLETWLKCDLQKLVSVQALHGVVFSADSAGNKIGVEVTDGGQPASLSGGVMGYLIRADGATLAVTGTLSGSKAYIVLPSSAYAVVGPLDIVIKNVITGQSTATLAACRVYVQRSTTDTIIDPGHVIPSLEELLAQIDAMETATANANAAASSANTAASSANTARDRANTAAAALENMDAAAQTLAPGSSATAQVRTVSGHYRVALGIPQGVKGDTGDAAAISSQASAWQVSDSGTAVPSGEWLDSVPAVPQGKFLWGRLICAWNDGSTTVQYTVSRQGRDGTGSVSSVGGLSPDSNGDVPLFAIPQSELITLVEGGEADAD